MANKRPKKTSAEKIHGKNPFDLMEFRRHLDEEVAKAFPEPDYDLSVKDQLFDILMERLDIAKARRADILAAIGGGAGNCKSPVEMASNLPSLADSMAKTLSLAGVSTEGPQGALRVAGLTLGYLWVLRSWAEDESEDLSATMATLDRTLSWIDLAAQKTGL
jgi:ubiquinone biosynthesis protein COQ9